MILSFTPNLTYTFLYAMKHILAGLAATLLLSGCNSFNIIRINTEGFTRSSTAAAEPTIQLLGLKAPKILSAPLTEKEAPATQAETQLIQSIVEVCPKYQYPKIPPMPQSPANKLKALDPSDDAGVDLIVREYIEQLRNHIVKARAILHRSVHEYEKRWMLCAARAHKK